jgi:hypothetical protein
LAARGTGSVSRMLAATEAFLLVPLNGEVGS